jgi:nucleotide-binding universal stress UspA family protein
MMAPFRRILVPLDGSELAEKTLKPAVRLAQAAAREAAAEGEKVRLVLLRAASPLTMMAADPYLYDEMMRMSLDEARTYLNTLAADLNVAPALLATKAVTGSPADAIVHYAEENAVDLIMMSSHGRTGSRRWVYGSVAEKVMHHAPCATAIIRSHVSTEMFQNRKILVPLDGSELAERALEPALGLAKVVDSDVLLFRVVPERELIPEFMIPADEATYPRGAVNEQDLAEAEAYLQRVYNAHDDRRLFFDVKAVDGDVADTIVSYAEANHVDLIVISSHGRSGIGRWLHGSVAEKVLRGADCATLIIRPPRS